jgi:hypothetical protein
MAKIKDRIEAGVAEVYAGSNALRASEFGRIYFWQEVSTLADAKLKKAWEAKQGGHLPSDDDMRAAGEGDHVLERDKRFTVLAKVSKARESFDLDGFIAKLAKKHKLDPVALKAMADGCKKVGKASLSKRVLEAE